MSTPVSPDVPGLIAAALPMLACMAILAWRRLGQADRLALATVRLVVQLLLLGIALDWVFASNSPWVTIGVALLMLVTSAHTVGSRQGGASWALRFEAFTVMLVGAAVVMAIAVRLSLNLRPWHEARVVIPLLGMVLGNSVNGVSLAAERLESELRAERDRVELRLALGASSRQAAHEPLRAAVRAALTPTIQGMMIAGIVAIPGMMTGQVLAGADVRVALRYQILVYFLIAGTVGVSTLGLLAIRLRRYFTPAHQLRLDRAEGRK